MSEAQRGSVPRVRSPQGLVRKSKNLDTVRASASEKPAAWHTDESFAVPNSRNVREALRARAVMNHSSCVTLLYTRSGFRGQGA